MSAAIRNHQVLIEGILVYAFLVTDVRFCLAFERAFHRAPFVVNSNRASKRSLEEAEGSNIHNLLIPVMFDKA